MRKICLFFFLILLSGACSKSEKKYEETKAQVDARNLTLSCLRWIDRDLYFANQDPFNASINNQFHKETIKSVLKDIQVNTNLGEDYFRMKEVNPDLLDPIRNKSLPVEEYRSFILIWNDDRFEQFVVRNLCDPAIAAINQLNCFINLPDRNAVAVINTNAPRKYYIIFRSSCFEASARCIDQKTQLPLSTAGVNALVARQFGLLLGLQPKAECINGNPSELPNSAINNVMCKLANGDQWNENVGTESAPEYVRRDEYYNSVNGQLATILANPNYFGDIGTTAGCIKKGRPSNEAWMDRTLYPSCPTYSEDLFQIYITNLKETLDEIAANTLLGEGYFKLPTSVDPTSGESNITCQPENSVNLVLERQNNFDDPYSYVLLWDDTKFNQFVNSNELGIADANGFILLNAAWKKKYKMIIRSSCFTITNGQPDPDCFAGNNGVIESGTSPDGHYKALIARQLGMMIGLETKNCNDNPMDVMCADLPNKEQWGEKYKKRFFNKFNNYLEIIGNDPDFFKQVFEEIEDTSDEEE